MNKLSILLFASSPFFVTSVTQAKKSNNQTVHTVVTHETTVVDTHAPKELREIGHEAAQAIETLGHDAAQAIEVLGRDAAQAVRIVDERTNTALTLIDQRTHQELDMIDAQADQGVKALDQRTNHDIRAIDEHATKAIHALDQDRAEIVKRIDEHTSKLLSDLQSHVNSAAAKLDGKTHEAENAQQAYRALLISALKDLETYRNQLSNEINQNKQQAIQAINEKLSNADQTMEKDANQLIKDLENRVAELNNLIDAQITQAVQTMREKCQDEQIAQELQKKVVARLITNLNNYKSNAIAAFNDDVTRATEALIQPSYPTETVTPAVSCVNTSVYTQREVAHVSAKDMAYLAKQVRKSATKAVTKSCYVGAAIISATMAGCTMAICHAINPLKVACPLKRFYNTTTPEATVIVETTTVPAPVA